MLFIWQGNDKPGALSRFAFYPDIPMVPGYYFFTDSQADTGPLILVTAVQVLKNPENIVEMLFFYTNTIIFHSNFAIFPVLPGHYGTLNMDNHFLIRFGKFKGIGKQLLISTQGRSRATMYMISKPLTGQ